MNPNILFFIIHLVSGLAVVFFLGSATKNTWDDGDKVLRVCGITGCIGGSLMVVFAVIGLIQAVSAG